MGQGGTAGLCTSLAARQSAPSASVPPAGLWKDTKRGRHSCRAAWPMRQRERTHAHMAPFHTPPFETSSNAGGMNASVWSWKSFRKYNYDLI